MSLTAINGSIVPEAKDRKGTLPSDCWANLTIRTSRGGSFALRVQKRGFLEIDAFPNGQAVFDADEAPDVVMAIQEFLGSL